MHLETIGTRRICQPSFDEIIDFVHCFHSFSLVNDEEITDGKIAGAPGWRCPILSELFQRSDVKNSSTSSSN